VYKIVIDFGIPTNPLRLVKMYLNETYNKFNIDKSLSDIFPIQNALK